MTQPFLPLSGLIVGCVGCSVIAYAHGGMMQDAPNHSSCCCRFLAGRTCRTATTPFLFGCGQTASHNLGEAGTCALPSLCDEECTSITSLLLNHFYLLMWHNHGRCLTKASEWIPFCHTQTAVSTLLARCSLKSFAQGPAYDNMQTERVELALFLC